MTTVCTYTLSLPRILPFLDLFYQVSWKVAIVALAWHIIREQVERTSMACWISGHLLGHRHGLGEGPQSSRSLRPLSSSGGLPCKADWD
jgi:hypothetical protein